MEASPDSTPDLGLPMRFFEWNYNSNHVVEYERLGECNGCGDCCVALIRFFVLGKIKGQPNEWQIAANGGVATSGHGVWLEVWIGSHRRFFQMMEIKPESMQCVHFTEDRKCDIHFTKPLLHKVWPLAPSQVTPFERCSYSFREIARRPIAISESTSAPESVS